MRTLPKNISAHPDGYLVRIERGDLKWSAFVSYSRPDALAEAIKLRDRFYKVTGPVAHRVARHARSNTDVVGITETTHWNHGHEYHKFNVHVRGQSKSFYYGRRCTRAQAFKAAVAHRAQAIGKTPAEILPKLDSWL